jgi:hypothetical protein
MSALSHSGERGRLRAAVARARLGRQAGVSADAHNTLALDEEPQSRRALAPRPMRALSELTDETLALHAKWSDQAGQLESGSTGTGGASPSQQLDASYRAAARPVVLEFAQRPEHNHMPIGSQSGHRCSRVTGVPPQKTQVSDIDVL